MKKFFQQRNRGFTLVEVLVAISIFTVSILALMAVLTQGIAQTNYAKTKIIATYLAQEGIEYMRNMRDTFVLYNPTSGQVGWDLFNTKITGAPASCTLPAGCFFNADNLFTIRPQTITQMTLTACGASCPTLLYDSATGSYGYTPTGSTITSSYTRKIKFDIINANETKVFSTVSWIQSSGNFRVTFSENLFNWVQ
jgi:prepilin-type N-terminal cleavage/methylation domain-containing protein